MNQDEVMAEKYLHIVQTSPTPGREDEFNEWYENVHVPQILTLPDFVSGQRFRLLAQDPFEGPRYLAVYEIETDDIAATLDTVRNTAPARTKSGAIDISVSVVLTYEAIGELQHSISPAEASTVQE
jgi:hypothetical protein